MKLIVEYDEIMKCYLRQYANTVEALGKGFAALDIDEKHLNWLRKMTRCMEENKQIELGLSEENKVPLGVKKEDSILAYIGTKMSDDYITHHYNFEDQVMKEKQGTRPSNMQMRISCSSKNNRTDMISIIKCMHALNETAQKFHKPLIIYANMKIEQNGCRCKKLLYQILNQYLDTSDSMFIINTDQEDKVYENASGYDTLKESSIYKEKADEKSRQTATLYNDVFYMRIDPNEEIYIILLTEAISDPKYYEALGLRYVRLEGGFNMLYGRKGDFDRNQEIIRPQVQADYRINILTYAPCQRDNANPQVPYYLPPEDLRYTGKGVYIGVIATDDVDYTNLALRTRDGTTRIACIWEQTLADQGIYYQAEQINAALASPNPGELIRLPVDESMSTAMLAVAGGWSIEAGYRGIAPEAELLVAKIRPVSEHMQRIYGGMPNPKAAIMQDAVIGMQKLINLAQNQGRPIVLLMPFNGNIDSHDGSLIIQEMVSLIARRPNVTLIVPTGEEADKQHHYSIEGEQEGQRTINLRVEQPGQNVVGVIYQWEAIC